MVSALDGAAGPVTAAELAEVLADQVPISSLYRTLTLLEQEGVVTRFPDPGALVRFELAEWLAGHHHHLVCVGCGATRDVEISQDLEHQIARVARATARAESFDLAGHRLDLEGWCTTCR